MHTALFDRRARTPSAAAGLLARMSDVTLIAFSALVTTMVLPHGGDHPSAEVALVASAATFAMVLFPTFGVYRTTRDRSKYSVAGRTCIAWIVAQACAALVMLAPYHTLSVPTDWHLCWALASSAALIVSRLVAGTIFDRLGNASERDCPVAIVGMGTHVDAVLDRIARSPSPGFRAVTVLDMSNPGAPDDHRGLPRFDELGAFASHVRAHAIPEVWVALPIADTRAVVAVRDAFSHDLVNIRFMPDISTLAMFDGEMIDLVGTPAINLVASPLSSRARVQKALFDRAFAAAALIGTAPLLLAIAVTIRLSSPGPVLFRQRRKGADGKVFTIYKFRTMRLHADADGAVRQATRDDPRVTRIGAFLRRTSLDELPQFINVLRGEMSVVGPRPHAIEHDDLYQPIVDGYIHRYRVKPGITGWAQINGLRGETDRVEKMRRRVEADLYYLRNWSFALDMRIVVATVTHGWTNSNAY
ncbi:undecaprenyl-phosphate glucose phosphotransferase [Burkholderia sp. Ac-20353]|uniref:undecaprenyl-phosphate glucose phosphotransferase n=1 Tax=Burkholderia sp. Ac-20353 TaxID=2703894 RepID=UPI00197C84E9|nr:undecaprenyl-phosphate glucose phosphotransferase [Burkholderia sp. Ac-20353]MBN3786708.1 undecaprenyl-phosphate glucose phosphotransferase [Burkholderia sp. Ac-20353]